MRFDPGYMIEFPNVRVSEDSKVSSSPMPEDLDTSQYKRADNIDIYKRG